MLKSDGGVFTTITMSDEKFQWQYPNIWGPCQYIAYKALQRYDYLTESDWIKEKYKQLVEKNFLKHGKLFEKYNGVTCSIDAASEYDTPEMLGWTADVYMFFITIKTGYEKSRRSSEMK